MLCCSIRKSTYVPVFREDPLLYFDLLKEGFDTLPRKEESQIEILDGARHIVMLEES